MGSFLHKVYLLSGNSIIQVYPAGAVRFNSLVGEFGDWGYHKLRSFVDRYKTTFRGQLKRSIFCNKNCNKNVPDLRRKSAPCFQKKRHCWANNNGVAWAWKATPWSAINNTILVFRPYSVLPSCWLLTLTQGSKNNNWNMIWRSIEFFHLYICIYIYVSFLCIICRF